MDAAEGDDRPAAALMVEVLNENLRQGAESGALRATAVVEQIRNLKIPNGGRSDVVRIALEHNSGYCVNALFPYTRDPAGEIEFGQNWSTTRSPGAVFDACGPREG